MSVAGRWHLLQFCYKILHEQHFFGRFSHAFRNLSRKESEKGVF